MEQESGNEDVAAEMIARVDDSMVGVINGMCNLVHE